MAAVPTPFSLLLCMVRPTDGSIKLREGGVEAPIPNSLYRRIAGVQAAKDLSWDEACEEVAKLADSGSAKFQKQVKETARKLYNTELMKQMNKARLTIQKTADDYARINYGTIRFPCSTCKQNLSWNLSDPEDKEQIMDILKDGGIGNWHHTTCGPPPSSG